MSDKKFLESLAKFGQPQKENSDQGIKEKEPTPVPQTQPHPKATTHGNLIITSRGLKFPKPCHGTPLERHAAGIQHERFGEMYPEVAQWLTRYESDGTKKTYASALLYFCIDRDITPREFGELWHNTDDMVKARNLVTDYVQSIMIEDPGKARAIILSTKSFFRFYSKGFRLPLDTGQGGACEIPLSVIRKKKKVRYDWGSLDTVRTVANKLIDQMKTLRDQTILTILYRCGFRDNVLNSLKLSDVKDYLKINDENLLCLTITPELDKKQRGIELTLPNGKYGYYTYLAGDGLGLLNSYLESDWCSWKGADDLVFSSEFQGRRTKAKWVQCNFQNRFSKRVKDLGYVGIWPHQFRGLFNQLAHEVLKKNQAEFLTGHKLTGVQESYQWRNKEDLAIAYLKIRFTPEHAFIDQINTLQKRVAIERKKVTTPTTAATPQFDKTSEFEVREPTTYPTKPKESEIPTQPILENGLLWCPFKDEWINKATCDVCKTQRFDVYKSCQEQRLADPNSPLFKPSKPRPT